MLSETVAPSSSLYAATAGGVDIDTTRVILSVLILILLAILAGRSVGRRRSVPWLQQLFGTGYVFLAVGVLLGPYGATLLTEEMLEGLRPVTVFCLGWVGFLVGMQCEVRLLLRIPARMHIFAYGQSTMTALVVAGFALIGMQAMLNVGLEESVVAALLLGVCSGVSSQALPALAQKYLSREDRTTLTVATGLEDLLMMVIAVLLLAFLTHGGGVYPFLTGLGWLSGTIGLGVACGYAFYLFMRARLTSEETLTIGLGMVALAAGAALYLHLASPSLCFFAGIVFVNAPLPRKESFYRTLTNAERPIVFLLFILAGAHLALPETRFLWLAVVTPVGYAFFRAAAKILSARVLVPIANRPHAESLRTVGRDAKKFLPVNRWIGFGLMASGPLSLVFAFDYYLLAQSPLSGMIFWTVALGALVSELFVPTLSRFLAAGANDRGKPAHSTSTPAPQPAQS